MTLWEVLGVMRLLCILTLVVVRHIYTCDKMLDEGFTECLVQFLQYVLNYFKIKFKKSIFRALWEACFSLLPIGSPCEFSAASMVIVSLLMLLNCGVGETLESPLDCKEISPECSLGGLMLKLKPQYFAHLM